MLAMPKVDVWNIFREPQIVLLSRLLRGASKRPLTASLHRVARQCLSSGVTGHLVLAKFHDNRVS
jgi:hypothetical protein